MSRRTFFAIAFVVVVEICHYIYSIGTYNYYENTSIAMVMFYSHIGTAVRYLLSSFVGGCLARKSFVGTAFFLAIAIWIIKILLIVAFSPHENAYDLSFLLQYSWYGPLLSATAAAIGAYFGQRFFQHRIQVGGIAA